MVNRTGGAGWQTVTAMDRVVGGFWSNCGHGSAGGRLPGAPEGSGCRDCGNSSGRRRSCPPSRSFRPSTPRASPATSRSPPRGATRGGRGQPGPDETGLDGIESRIVESVGDLRRRGLDSYGENVRVYDARLARAVDAREAVEMAASKARSDFQAAVAVWQARMATPAANIELAKGAFARFRAEHGVGHVAVRADLLSWIFVALLVIALESAANAFLFRAVMSTGWAGGHDHRRGDLGFERGDRGARHLLRAQPQPPALVLEAVRAGGGADRHRPLPRLQPRGGAPPRRAGAGARSSRRP